jgi:hypothetical protein
VSLYLLGNLFGRLALSYAVVWLILFFAARFDWRLAFRRSSRWWAVLGVLVLFALGVAGFYRRGAFL